MPCECITPTCRLLRVQPPFEADSALEMLIAQAREAVTPPLRIKDDIPSDLEAVVLRCREKDPATRYQTAAELDDALHACQCSEWSQEEARSWWAKHAPYLSANRDRTALLR